ncbi:MAG TPA: glycosyltransferase family 2 protein [Acidobacteriaceae bacterium]|nr:glycosyltransferase family 2 protein [Acidobacteriaceae bacterium]
MRSATSCAVTTSPRWPLPADLLSSGVQVLLATFDGERFLREQIDSILAQSLGETVTILARDDGSTDSTQQILDDYSRRFPDRLRVLPAGTPGGGAKENFLALLQASTAPYIAFADQDDVWLPNKLELELTAMHALEAEHGPSTPLLVFSDLRVVDDTLAPISASFWRHRNLNPRNIHRLGRLLMENVVTGCTALLNAPLANLARSMPPSAHMHDWWVALLASTLGHATALDQQLVLYRQHQNNVIGASRSAPPLGVRARLQHERCRERWQQSVHQARDLLKLHGADMPAATRRQLEDLLRCDASPSAAFRLTTMLRRGYFISKPQANLATAWFLLKKTG